MPAGYATVISLDRFLRVMRPSVRDSQKSCAASSKSNVHRRSCEEASTPKQSVACKEGFTSRHTHGCDARFDVRGRLLERMEWSTVA